MTDLFRRKLITWLIGLPFTGRAIAKATLGHDFLPANDRKREGDSTDLTGGVAKSLSESKPRGRFNLTKDCPLIETGRVSPNVSVLITGQLFLSYRPELASTVVGIPDFKDHHLLKISVDEVDRQGNPVRSVWTHQGLIDQDIRLEVTKPFGSPFCFYGDPNGLVESDALDLGTFADLMRADFHNKPLRYDNTYLKRSIFLTAGRFFTAQRSRKPLMRTKGGIDDKLCYIATAVGANITLDDDGSAALKWQDGTDVIPGFIADPTKQCRITIDNNPPHDSDMSGDKSDFGNYYKIVTNIPPNEQFDFRAFSGSPALAKFVRRTPKTEDVPCVPGGGGFP